MSGLRVLGSGTEKGRLKVGEGVCKKQRRVSVLTIPAVTDYKNPSLGR